MPAGGPAKAPGGGWRLAAILTAARWGSSHGCDQRWPPRRHDQTGPVPGRRAGVMSSGVSGRPGMVTRTQSPAGPAPGRARVTRPRARPSASWFRAGADLAAAGWRCAAGQMHAGCAVVESGALAQDGAWSVALAGQMLQVLCGGGGPVALQVAGVTGAVGAIGRDSGWRAGGAAPLPLAAMPTIPNGCRALTRLARGARAWGGHRQPVLVSQP